MVFVRGHAAPFVELTYNSTGNTLTVVIEHGVEDRTTHYINTVSVYVNGVGVVSESYTSQPDDAIFVYQYDVEANDGDVIQVTTTCILGGTTSDSITVGDEQNDTNGNGQVNGQAIPGFSGIWLITVISTIISVLVIRKKFKK
ncbi:MAG: hypothetical protein ACFFDT_06050 [Candidatus Hodarchaeota archaeon]